MKKWLYHRAVRVTARILLVLMGLYVLLLLVLQLVVSANKDQLLAEINRQLSAGLRGDVQLKNLRLNVWRRFPKVEVTLENLLVADTLYHRPILSVERISTGLGWLDVLGRHINIESVSLYNGYLHLFTDSTGYNNHYLLAPGKKTTAPGEKKQVFIQEIMLHAFTAVSENKLKNKRFEVLFHDATAHLHNEDTLIGIQLQEKALVRGLGFNLEKGSYLSNTEVEGKWEMTYRPGAKVFAFPATEVHLNRHPYELQGAFYLGDSTSAHFSISVKAKQVIYREAAKLLTVKIQRKLLLVDLEKPVDVNATIAGSLGPRSTPLILVNWVAAGNTLVTPGADFEHCSFSGSFSNEKIRGQPRTDENSVLNLDNFTGDWDGILLKGKKVTVYNFVQPVLQFDFSSTCSFPALDEQFGLQTLRFKEGQALLDLQYNGPLVADATVMENLSGRLLVKNGLVHYEPRNLDFTHCNGEVLFSANDLVIRQLECDIGSTHFKVAMAGKAISKLAGNDPGKASILCSVYTAALNLGDFKSLFKGKSSYVMRKKKTQRLARTALQFDELLEKGSFQLNIKADTIRQNHFTAGALTGSILFEQNDWQLQQISLRHAGGQLNIRGRVLPVASGHQLSASIELNNVDVRRLFYAFDNFGQNGITYHHLQGKLHTTANINMNVSDNGTLVANSIKGLVYFSLRDGALINHEPIQRIQKYVFKNRDLKNIRFAELKDSLVIKNDEVFIRRMEVQSNVMTLYIEGIYSMKGNTDISIQVPLSNFLEKREDGRPVNKGAYRKAGASVYLRAKPDLKGNIKLGLDLFKKFRKRKEQPALQDSL